jgi:hypothetical protein
MTRSRSFGLSKTKITMFEQCSKRLWLSVHRRELAEQDQGAESRFASGHVVGAIACDLLPTGTMVEAEPDLSYARPTTRALLDGSHDQPIFEATLEHDGVLVRIDILEPAGSGAWRMVEVKSSTSVKDYHLGDLATQLWVAENAGMSITSAAIRHIDGDFVLQQEGIFSGLFADAELVALARTTLRGPEPDLAPGDHCFAPFSCEFMVHCHKDLPAAPEWPVTILPYGRGKRFLAEHIGDLLKLDPADLSHETDKLIHRATITGEAYHDRAGARAAMKDWTYPRTWLDFETIGFAAPRWVGTRPYQQVPFQFSAHVEELEGVLFHHEFLSLDGLDPRRACALALLNHVPETGAIIAYNASFEKRCIAELAQAFPDLSERLACMVERLVDLLPVTRANWYHRDQRGSWSIKAVLPTIASELDYIGLEVKDGSSAQEAYLEAIGHHTSSRRRNAIDAALRKYCGRDTEAMIALARHLEGRGLCD